MLKAGFYEKEITPPLGDDIPGYSGPRNSTSIHDPLFSRAVSIRTGEAPHECVIIITSDVIHIPPEIYDGVINKVEKWTGVPQKNIMIAATHTHTSGPVQHDGEFRIHDDAWTEITIHSTADAAIMAYKRMVDAKTRFACADVEGLSFCRDYIMKDGSVRTNPGFDNPDIVERAGKSDPSFPVLFFFDESDTPIGALTSFACHHDSKGGTELSADYSGILSGYMKDYFGRHFVNVFLQGACGNLNHADYTKPRPDGQEPGFIRLAKRLAEAEIELFNNSKSMAIDAVYSEKRIVPIRKRDIPEAVVEEHRWALENVDNDWYQMDIAKPENWIFKRTHAVNVIRVAESSEYHGVYIQVIRLGNDLSIYATPGEIFVELQLDVKKNSPTKYNMVSGTALKGIDGYVPTEEIYNTTSYASALGSAPLAPEALRIMTEKALEIAEEIDKQTKK